MLRYAVAICTTLLLSLATPAVAQPPEVPKYTIDQAPDAFALVLRAVDGVLKAAIDN